MNKKVLIISVNEFSMSLFPDIYPIGPLYIAKQLELKYQVRLMNMEFYNIPKFQKAFRQFNPDIVLVSIRNRINFTAKLKSVITFIKKQKKEFFVGGTAVTLYKKFAEEYLGISSKQIITGEFESMMHSIFPKVSSTHKVEKMKMPDGSFMNYTEKEIIQNREFGIESRRGCHFNCLYCDYHIFVGNKIRKRKIATVVKNICDLYSHGIRRFRFIDPIFNYPKDYGYRLCEALSKKNLKAGFSANIFPLNITDEDCKIWKKIGLYVFLGVDGLSEKALKSWNKPFNIKELSSSMKTLKKNKMNYGLDLMLGGPGQTLSDVKKELAQLEKINPQSCVITVGALMRNSKLEKIKNKNNTNSSEDLFISNLIDIKELKKLIKLKRKFYRKKNWLFKTFWTGKNME